MSIWCLTFYCLSLIILCTSESEAIMNATAKETAVMTPYPALTYVWSLKPKGSGLSAKFSLISGSSSTSRMIACNAYDEYDTGADTLLALRNKAMA